jgi:putative spermidine/putrescine transport system substrate-binding protein
MNNDHKTGLNNQPRFLDLRACDRDMIVGKLKGGASRRDMLQWLSAAGIAAAAGAAGILADAAVALAQTSASAQAEPPKPDQIVVNDSGGSMGTAMRKAFFSTYEKKYGIRVVETSPVDFGKLRAMVESGNVEWQVTEIGGQDAIRAVKLGLVEKIDDKLVDRLHYPEKARQPDVFASSVYTTIIGYRTDVFKNGTHPKSWAEWWDVKKFPGARSMRNHPTDNLEFALIADGVPKDKLYPLDLDRAFRKLDQIKPHVTAWWSTGAQPAQFLLDKEVVLATGWNGRFYDLIKKGGPIEIEWNEGALKLGSFVIPKGAKHQYWAQKFLAEMAVPQQQAVYASELGYPGLNLESLKYVDAKVKEYLPTNEKYLAKQFWIDDAWYAENGAVAQERWNAWMLKKP